MKAKEYVLQYKPSSNEDERLTQLAKIAHDFLYEMKGMIATRNPQRESAFISIFKEQNDKWKAFINKVDHGLKDPEHFLIDFIKLTQPKLHDSWVEIGGIK